MTVHDIPTRGYYDPASNAKMRNFGDNHKQTFLSFHTSRHRPKGTAHVIYQLRFDPLRLLFSAEPMTKNRQKSEV